MRRTFFVVLLGLIIAGGSWPAIAHQAPTTATQTTQTEDLISANNQFAFELYDALSTEEDNLIFSPYSISMALAMVHAGADGNTATQMAETLHFDMAQDTLDSDFLDLQTALNAEVEAPEGILPSELNIVNGLWNHIGFPFRQAYIDLLQNMYQAGATPVDFVSDAEVARELINNWISENTNERIENMLAPGSISTDTRLILVNAIFFKGTWLAGFDPNLTQDGPFTVLDGSTVTAPMMHQMSQSHGYYTGDHYQVVELQFQDGFTQDAPYEMAMMFILPDEGAFEEVQASLNAEWFDTAQQELAPTYLDLVMPTFSHESSLDLIETMRGLGMTDAFSAELADLSGMMEDGSRSLYISLLLHRANLDVDENGTEAAAATVVGVSVTSIPLESLEVAFDRPFIYAIYDRVSGSILFLGRVINPDS